MQDTSLTMCLLDNFEVSSGCNPQMRVCSRLVFLFDVHFVVCWTYLICLSLSRQVKELVEVLDLQWIKGAFGSES